MIMEKVDKQQVFSKLCSISSTLVLPIILLSLLFSFLVFISISKPFPLFLTICITLLSSMFLVTLTKKKGFQEKNIVHENSIHVTQTEVTQQSESTESYELQDEEAKSCYPFVSVTERSSFFIMDKKFDLKVQDSESSTGSIMCESFEIDQNGNQDVGISDNLASENDDYYDDEEDSLIEIDLPRSFFSDLTEEPKQKFESKLPDFLPGSIFMEQGLMELLDEIIEDENLIEIDISMGSKNTEDYRLKKEFASLEDQCVLSE